MFFCLACFIMHFIQRYLLIKKLQFFLSHTMGTLLPTSCSQSIMSECSLCHLTQLNLLQSTFSQLTLILPKKVSFSQPQLIFRQSILIVPFSKFFSTSPTLRYVLNFLSITLQYLKLGQCSGCKFGFCEENIYVV